MQLLKQLIKDVPKEALQKYDSHLHLHLKQIMTKINKSKFQNTSKIQVAYILDRFAKIDVFHYAIQIQHKNLLNLNTKIISHNIHYFYYNQDNAKKTAKSSSMLFENIQMTQIFIVKENGKAVFKNVKRAIHQIKIKSLKIVIKNTTNVFGNATIDLIEGTKYIGSNNRMTFLMDLLENLITID